MIDSLLAVLKKTHEQLAMSVATKDWKSCDELLTASDKLIDQIKQVLYPLGP